MVVVAMAQILMASSFNALVVSIGGIVETFETPATSVGTAIVVYSLAVAGFIMLGAKLGQRLGARRVFVASTALFGAAMALVALAPSVQLLIAAQGLAGLAAAALVPSLVVLIAAHYEGRQRAQALGYLGGAQALAGVLAFLVAGSLGATVGWRYAFGLLVLLALATLALSPSLADVPARPDTAIDVPGALLAAGAVGSVSVGLDKLNHWGIGLARPAAPFDVFALSPAPFLVLLGVVLGQAFFARAARRRAAGRAPLVALEVLDPKASRVAVGAMLGVVTLESAAAFLVPLYVQVVQGRSSLATAFAMMPFSLSMLASAVLVVRLFERHPPRRLARAAFVVTASGLAFLAVVVRNDWSTPPVVLGLVVTGLGIGSLATLLFDVLVSGSPPELAGDAGSLRGTANNLGAAVGTALVAALVVSVLEARVHRALEASPTLTPALLQQANVDEIDFVSNERLREVLAAAEVPPDEAREALAINEAARLTALKASFLLLAALSLLAIVPAGRLPGRLPGAGPGDGRA
jgi:MFS family permease